MSFRPQMTSFTEGIRLSGPLSFRGWDGGVADLWQAEGLRGGGGHYVSPDPRVVIFLPAGPGAAASQGAGPAGQQPVRISQAPDFSAATPAPAVFYIPAGLPVWSRITAAGRFCHLDLHLAAPTLAAMLGGAGPVDLGRPVLLERAPRLETLAGFIAGEVASPSRHGAMFEALIRALIVDLFALPPETAAEPATEPATESVAEPASARARLAEHQLRAVTRLMQARLAERVSVAELAAAARLSESWFAHGFKATTGLTPQRWQRRMRITAVQDLLRGEPGLPLAEIAAACGFADQAHLTRAFRAETGTTPAAWRRETLVA